ncbi:MAG TPA: Ig-like domain repeat protein, partial [Candidatus Dormibacteraeota bacterium]|nr:Ig-like domain repeat protein [Candidatus Dormibacteraeota bacterium]
PTPGTCSGYPKPGWQTDPGVPSDNVRHLPDVSLFASPGALSKSFYLLCEADIPVPAGSAPICMPDAQGHFTFFGAGGTSASSPAFAGIVALINQQQGSRQGNANPLLYKIAAMAGQSCNSSTAPLTGSTCSFYDVTNATTKSNTNNSVPCTGGSPNCSSPTAGTNGVLVSPSSTTTPAWTTGTGYDLATGLGSVNVTNLLAAWKTAAAALTGTTTSLTINGSLNPGTIAHGTQVTAAVTVTPATGTVQPTGDVALLAPTPVNGSVSDGTLTNGTVSIKTSFLPGGTYNITAHYAGDGTFKPSDSNAVPITVTKENSSLLAEMITFNAIGQVTSTNATNFPYGSGPTLRMDVLNHTGNSSNCQPLVTNGTTTGCALDAAGSVAVTDNGTALPESPVKINSAGHTEDQIIQLTGGSHTVVATYGGDISYNAAPAVTLNLTVTLATTTPTVTSSANPVLPNQQVTLSVTIATQSNGAGPTGTVTFKDGNNTIGTPQPVTPVAATSTTFASGTASLTTTFTSGSHSITAVYGGDTNYATSTSSPFTENVGVATTTTVTSSSASVSSGSSVTLTATVAATGTGASASPTGTVQFMNGSTALGTAQTCTAVSGASPPACKATLTTTLSFFAPPAGLDRIPRLRVPWFLLAAMVALMLLFLLNLKRVPARYRRLYATAGFLLFAGLLVGLAAGCSGAYSGGGGPHTDNITAVYSGDSTYAGSTSAPLPITVK